ncbi:serine hydrolase domain-containing protein [Planktotalea sp.]|uniref:serine hydrolase domain-containing protein n=1 Tax=Planktotalea sp. TaxID=2029877 RepID=UPI003D6AFEBA
MNVKRVFGAVVLLCGASVLGLTVLMAANPRQSPTSVSSGVDANSASQRADTQSQGQTPERKLAEIEGIWRDWMKRNGVEKSAMSLSKGGDILKSAGVGREPDRAYPLASLSKAITAICLNEVLSAHEFDWSSTIGELAAVLSQENITPAKEMKSLTLAEFARHKSGLPRIVHQRKTALRKSNLPPQGAMTRAALSVPENFGKRGDFLYSNANYAVLGSVAAALTGKSYGDTCKEEVLAPIGIKDAVADMRGGYGGWSMSSDDYARFASHWFELEKVNARQFAKGGMPIRGSYGFGSGITTRENGRYYSHFGKWTNAGPRKQNVGALFLVAPDGIAFVASWQGSRDYDIYHDLKNKVMAALAQ